MRLPAMDTADGGGSGFFAAGGGKRGNHVRSADATPETKTARARVSASKKKGSKRQQRALAMGPTPERLAKGDIAAPRTAGGFCRSLSMAEQLRDGRERGLQKPISRLTPDQLVTLHEKGRLDHDARTSEGMFQAAEKLRRHYDGLGLGARAQDLNRVVGSNDSDPLGEEAWVHHHQVFQIACKLMGWHDNAPHRGAGRITVAIVCEDMTITDAAAAHLPAGETTARKAAALDRLREGLWALASHWRMI